MARRPLDHCVRRTMVLPSFLRPASLPPSLPPSLTCAPQGHARPERCSSPPPRTWSRSSCNSHGPSEGGREGEEGSVTSIVIFSRPSLTPSLTPSRPPYRVYEVRDDHNPDQPPGRAVPQRGGLRG